LSATPNGKDHRRRNALAFRRGRQAKATAFAESPDIGNRVRISEIRTADATNSPSQKTLRGIRQPEKAAAGALGVCKQTPVALGEAPLRRIPLRSHNSLLHNCPSANAPAPQQGMHTRHVSGSSRRVLAAPGAGAFRGLLRKPLSAR
jgi:hypothetical protein